MIEDHGKPEARGPLHAVLRDEVYRIGREALINQRAGEKDRHGTVLFAKAASSKLFVSTNGGIVRHDVRAKFSRDRMTFLEKDNSDAVPTGPPGDLGRPIAKRHDSDVAVPDVEVFLEILANQVRPLSRYYKLLVGCSRGAVTFDHHDMIQEGIHERGDSPVDLAAPRFRELFFAAAPRSKQAGSIQPLP